MTHSITITDQDPIQVTVVNQDPIEITATTQDPIAITVTTAAGGEINTASNLGAGEGVFSAKVAFDLEFKSLIGGTNVTLSSDANEITIDSTGAGTSTFADNVFRIFDDITNTKELAWEVTAIAPATTRTWTAPDADIDFAVDGSGTFAGIASNNTFTGFNNWSDIQWTMRDSADATKTMDWQLANISSGFERTITMADQDLDLTPGTGSYATEAEGNLAATALQNVVEDLSPELGANLNALGNDILMTGGSLQFNTATGIVDTNNNEFLDFALVGSAINQFQMTNASAGTGPQLSVQGGDANIDWRAASKGSGDFVFLTSGDVVLFSVNDIIIRKFTATTTDATQTTIANIPITEDTSMTFTVQGHGRQNATGDTFSMKIEGCLRNEAGVTTFISDPLRFQSNNAGASTWDINVVASDAADELQVFVVGEAAHTINWKIRVDTVEE